MNEPSGAAFFKDALETPLGRFTLIANEARALVQAGWSPSTDDDAELRRGLFGLTEKLEAYFFEKNFAVLDSIPVTLGGTPFQQSVWRALREIPSGSSISYGELARRVGRPAAVRAVGAANGANPLGVVVPCHRVIGANGTLTGYGGGLPRKKWLLNHEAGIGPLFAGEKEVNAGR